MTFETILQELVERVPGALGAIFLDWEGESVGHFSFVLSPLDAQIFGAQWGVVWNDLRRATERAALGRPEELCVDTDRGSVLLRHIAEGYYVLLSLKRGTHLATALRELERGVVTLRAEM